MAGHRQPRARGTARARRGTTPLDSVGRRLPANGRGREDANGWRFIQRHQLDRRAVEVHPDLLGVHPMKRGEIALGEEEVDDRQRAPRTGRARRPADRRRRAVDLAVPSALRVGCKAQAADDALCRFSRSARRASRCEHELHPLPRRFHVMPIGHIIADERSQSMSKPTIPPPCIKSCSPNPATAFCDGCLRTVDEIARWGAPATWNAPASSPECEVSPPRRRSARRRSRPGAAAPCPRT